MRLRHLGVAAIAAALLFSACGDDSGGGGSTNADGFTPVKSGTLTVLTALPAPGFWEGEDPSNITGGYEYEMAKALSEKLGQGGKVTVVNTSFDALVAGQQKDFDVALAQISITDERKKVLDFTDPYFRSDQSAIVQKGTAVADLAAAKKLKWGVQTGTTGESMVMEKIKPEQDPQSFQDLAAAYTALAAGQVDAVMMDTAINLGQAKASAGKLEVAAQFENKDEYGAVVPKGSANLKPVNDAIAALKSDGTLGKLAETWLGADPSKIPFISLG